MRSVCMYAYMYCMYVYMYCMYVCMYICIVMWCYVMLCYVMRRCDMCPVAFCEDCLPATHEIIGPLSERWAPLGFRPLRYVYMYVCMYVYIFMYVCMYVCVVVGAAASYSVLRSASSSVSTWRREIRRIPVRLGRHPYSSPWLINCTYVCRWWWFRKGRRRRRLPGRRLERMKESVFILIHTLHSYNHTHTKYIHYRISNLKKNWVIFFPVLRKNYE